jgi:hypothetical protein
VAVRFVVAAAGAASALVEVVEFSFAVFASLPAMTGTAVMASTIRLDNNRFSVNIDGSLLFSAQFRLGHNTGRKANL